VPQVRSRYGDLTFCGLPRPAALRQWVLLLLLTAITLLKSGNPFPVNRLYRYA
jgi:hypothetical protein